MARELSRTDLANGTHVVKVVLDNDTLGQVIVPTGQLDQPGYEEMLALAVVNHHDQIRRRDMGGQA